MGRRERLAEILARENEKSALVNKVRSPPCPMRIPSRGGRRLVRGRRRVTGDIMQPPPHRRGVDAAALVSDGVCFWPGIRGWVGRGGMGEAPARRGGDPHEPRVVSSSISGTVMRPDEARHPAFLF